MSLTYKDAGIDKEAGYKQVKLIKGLIKRPILQVYYQI